MSLEASITKYERAMNKALGQTNNTAKRIESRFASMNQRVSAGFSSFQRNITAAFAATAAVRGAVQLVDSATRIENSLKVAGLAGEELEMVYGRLRDAALANAAPLESLVTLYGRAALVQKELGVSTEQLLQFSNTVALALRASGQSAQESSGALLQLSQALGSGVVRAEEFNSILEGAPTILQAAAAGIREADGSVAKLRQIMLDGQLSSKALFDGFLAGSQILEDKVANSTLTVSQAMENLQTRLIDVARDFDKGTGASRVLADGIIDLGDGIAELAVFLDNIVGPLQNFINGMNQGITAAQGLAAEISRITGLEKFGFDAAVATNNVTGGAGLVAQSSAADRIVSQTFEMIGKTPKDEALARALAGEAPQEPLRVVVDASPNGGQISVKDAAYAPPKTGGGGGKGGGSRSSADRFGDALDKQQQRIDVLNRETQLQSQLNPLVNDYGFAIERLRAQMELENAAKEAGLPLDDQRRQKIDELASGYAQATAEAARLAEAQNLAKQSAEDLANAGRQALDSIVDGFLEGKDAGEIFNNVLKDLWRNLLNMGLNGLFGGGSTAGNGLFGRLFGFSNGGYTGPGGKNQPAGLVHKGEVVWSQSDIARAGGVGTVEAMRKGVFMPTAPATSASSAAPSFSYAPSVDARGADVAAVARLEQVMSRQQAEFEGRVKQIVRGKGSKWR